MGHLLLLLVFLSSTHITMVLAMEKSALYRNPTGDFSVGDFKRNPFHYLWVKKITSSMVADQLDCTFLCVGEPKCYSFNMAAYPDSKGLYLCELLATDKYRATKKLHANATFHHYSPWSPCESDPCKNGADCVPEYELNSYRCHCKEGYYGIHCEHKVYKSCSEIKLQSPKAPSGCYVIDPDGDGGVTPFTVDCDMTDRNKVGVTVISHDSEDRTPVSGSCQPPGCYSRDIQYIGANLHQLGSLTAISTHCEQFIKYDCHSSVLLQNSAMYGWWVSRDGDKMTYWGGSNSSFPYKCACGVTGTCADKSRGCNCDKNDRVFREDSGMLTDKFRLPVIQLRFGDTDHIYEHGNHTLGKLKCYGISSNN